MVAHEIERFASAALLRLPPRRLLALAAGRRIEIDGHVLNPQVQLALRLRALRRPPELHDLGPAGARAEFARQVALYSGRRRRDVRVRELCADGPAGPIPVRLYVPRWASVPYPVLVYYHGGGGVIGDLDTHDPICGRLADEAGCAVASVAYRLAPEHPFPAGLDDAEAAYRWLFGQAPRLGGDPARFAVGGDSLGANLATNVARRVRDAAAPRFQLLAYPGVDFTMSSPSHRTLAEGYLLSDETMRWFRRHYLPAPELASDPVASPLWADDLAGLPPAYIATAGFDPLRDEGRAYADRLRDAGVAVTHRCESGLVHGFLSAADLIDEAGRAASDCAAAAADALA